MPISLRSNYRLPLSFIIFFVLTFFLIGEQLPSLPLYITGLEGGGDKVHILDLGPSDALHRPVAYLIIGTVIWALFRIFAWPVAWTLGALLWGLEQSFLTPLDQRPSISNIIIFTSTFWILLTLVPYFIYGWVDQRWGGVGKRNAILVVLIINILVLGFFVFQIYYLHNSYRSSGSRSGLPANTCPDKLITKKDKPTTANWNGKTVEVAGDVQNWVEQNCPGALKQP